LAKKIRIAREAAIGPFRYATAGYGEADAAADAGGQLMPQSAGVKLEGRLPTFTLLG